MMVQPLSVGGVTIEKVDVRSLSDDQIREINEFGNLIRGEAMPEDPPRPFELALASFRNLPPFLVIHTFYGRDENGALAASGWADYADTPDNRHLLEVDISVRSDVRRRGIATALLGLIADVSDAEARPRLVGGTSERVAAGEAFARTVGAEPGQRMRTNRLLLSDVDVDMVDRWIADGPKRAEGYSLVAIDGRYPDDVVEQVVEVSKVMNTAPRDDLDIEDWDLTVEQLRDWEKSMLASGSERWSLFARLEETGAFVGFTEVVWNAKSNPEVVHQYGTGVHPDHRGYALGKWLKAAMLRRVIDERPGVTQIRTGNANSNDPMLGINTQLGFKPYIDHTAWQIRIEQVRDYLGSKA